MQIREMRLSDVFTIAELEKKIFPDAWSVASLRGTIENNSILPLVAVDDDEQKITGYAFLMGAADEAEILRIAVSEDHRRKGIADLLMKEMTECGRTEGYSLFYLEVRAGNEPAISLYKKWGFLPVGRRMDYYKDPVEDAFIMELEIK